MTPSQPSGDATCPHCGSLLWFVKTATGLRFTHKMDSRLGRSILSKRLNSSSTASGATPSFKPGDAVRIREGTFASFEGKVAETDDARRMVIVTIDIFGRRTDVELEESQLEPV